jgi:hypothetical protein
LVEASTGSAHSEVDHAFDLTLHPDLDTDRFSNVTFHIGDSHELLPRFLEEAAALGANVDFALVDSDHSTEGVRQDVDDLLSSSSVGRTVILLHDTLNPRVRLGLERIDYASYDKVSRVELDFVQGFMAREGEHKDELWGGLGLIVVEAGCDHAPLRPPTYNAPNVYDAFVPEPFDARRSGGPAHPSSRGRAGARAEGRARTAHARTAVAELAPDSAASDRARAG